LIFEVLSPLETKRAVPKEIRLTLYSINDANSPNNKELDVTKKLIKLSEMLEKGLITEDEFKSQKEAI
jgi:hypothetical protein